MPSKIEWTDETWNPLRARNLATGGVGHFCVHASEGCRHCYAEAMQKRLFNNPIRFAAQDRAKVEVFLDDKALLKPFAWKKPRVVFPCSMSDLFGEWVSDEELDRIFAVMALTPQHTYKVLTKRAARMREYFSDTRARFGSEVLGTYEMIYNAMGRVGAAHLRDPHPYRKAFPQGMPWPLPNVQLGVSVEDQATADQRLPELLATPAAVRFASVEPLLGAVDLEEHLTWPCCMGDRAVCGCDGERGGRALDQVIVGGESGPKARPMHPDWARALRGQCQAAGVPFFFKQHGEWIGVPDLRNLPGGSGPGFGVYDHCLHDMEHEAIRVGKKAAGRLLDGREWNGVPG